MTGLAQSFGEFYRGKRVLVTGHTGLKGSWLMLWLQKLGAETRGIALAPRTPDSMYGAAALGREDERFVDLHDLERMKVVFAEFQPEVVFHLAAQALVGPAYDEPLLTFSTNVMGSLHVLECVRATPAVRAVVMITSDKCYENIEQIWGYREHDRLGGADPYSASKAAAEIAISAYVCSFTRHGDTRVATARAGNVVGGGDWSPLRLVPDCIRSLREGAPIRLRSPDSTRPWQFVLEPLAGYLLLGKRLVEGGSRFEGAWNFGPSVDNTVTVERGARCIVDTWGSGEILVERTGTFHESTLLQLDCTKAQRELGWRAVLGFEETMAATARWYKHQASDVRADLREFSLGQLNEYEARLDREMME